MSAINHFRHMDDALGFAAVQSVETVQVVSRRSGVYFAVILEPRPLEQHETLIYQGKPSAIDA